MSVTFIYTYVKPVKGHWKKPGSSSVKEAKAVKSILEAAPDSSLTWMKNMYLFVYLFSTWMFFQWGNYVLNVCITFSVLQHEIWMHYNENCDDRHLVALDILSFELS